MKKVFIFDFDGTLYSGPHKFDLVRGNVDPNKRYFLKDVNDDEYFKICEENPRWEYIFNGIDIVNHINYFKEKYNNLDISLKYFIGWQNDFIYDIVLDNDQIVDLKFMKELCENNSVYVVSNSSLKHVKYYMNKIGVDFNWFKKVFANEFLESDPSKKHYYAGILSAEKCKVHDVYVFGDSVIADLAPAVHLGMNAFYVTNSAHLKDLVENVIPDEF